jgi:hypothetical protein
MDELKFKYDVMYLAENRCELKRVKRKPFLKILADMFIVKASFAFCIIPFFALLLFLIGVPLKFNNAIAPFIVPLFFFPIMSYYEQHKNVNILTDNIRKIYMTKNGQIMKIEYAVPNSQWNRMRIMAIDLPDNEHERQYIINQLNERNLFVIDKR